MLRPIGFLGLALVVAACGASVHKADVPGDQTDDLGGDPGGDDAGDGDGDARPAPAGDVDMAMAGCAPSMSDLVGCTCDPMAMPRACWPAGADPKARHVGVCKDGTQACAGGGEFAQWGQCMGAVLPSKESC